jgi:5-formyltetrahydrofolate cyclo-ligase
MDFCSMKELKNRIRQILRHRKDCMKPEDRWEKSELICGHLMKQIREGETVMVYTSKDNEVNTTHLITLLIERGNPVVVPVIVKEDTSLRLSYLRSLSCLVPSTFGVPEPLGNEIPATSEDVDIIILPMLGFDRSGRRIGYGAGYYDRFLAQNRNLRKIGIAFACQEYENLPAEEHDVPLDSVITEEGIVSLNGDDRTGIDR